MGTRGQVKGLYKDNKRGQFNKWNGRERKKGWREARMAGGIQKEEGEQQQVPSG